jgi:hypothetical protein
MTVSPDDQARMSRIATVTFGMYAWLPGTAHAIDNAGSGVLVAHRLALTAKHVTEDMERLDHRHELGRGVRPGIEFDYSTTLYQVPRFGKDIRWATKVNWPSKDSDITVMSVVPDGKGSELVERTILPRAFYPWRLQPPPVGAEVRLFGFPLPALANEGAAHAGNVQFVEQDGVVEEVFEPIRTHGMLEFPCYRLSRPVNHGFSGGPVFYEGALAGIVSAGSSYDDRAWVASLWPLALMRYDDDAGSPHNFSDLFDSGTIRTVDWADVKSRVSRKTCKDALFGTTIEGRCDETHAVRSV